MTPAKPAQPIQEEDISHYVLGSDDTLKIWALGIEEISDKPVRIDPSGDIDLPVVGKVHARGLSLEELFANGLGFLKDTFCLVAFA